MIINCLLRDTLQSAPLYQRHMDWAIEATVFEVLSVMLHRCKSTWNGVEIDTTTVRAAYVVSECQCISRAVDDNMFELMVFE